MQISTPIAQYGSEPDEPGLYLSLFHGRKDQDDRMIEWGFNGPLIGPLGYAHTTSTPASSSRALSTQLTRKGTFPYETCPY
jgi:hypothetical protein